LVKLQVATARFHGRYSPNNSIEENINRLERLLNGHSRKDEAIKDAMYVKWYIHVARDMTKY
jgi:hypothetical protein